MQRIIVFFSFVIILIIQLISGEDSQSFDEAFYESDLQMNKNEFYDENDFLSRQMAEPDFVMEMLRNVAGPMDENYDYHEDGTKTKKQKSDDYNSYGSNSGANDYGSSDYDAQPNFDGNVKAIEKDAGPGPADYSDQLNYY